MTRDEILRLANEIRLYTPLDPPSFADQIHIALLYRFANLVADHEREACAQLCEDDGLLWGQRYAAAIRERGER